MRRRLAAVVAVVASMLIAASVAYAAQVNTYKVEGKTKPAKAGSKKKPKAISLDFSYQVGEKSGQRPSPVKRYTIAFYGVQSNGKYFKKCTAKQISDARSDSVCPKGSKVGSGFVKNQAGATANPADTSIPCDLDLEIYNSGRNRAALYLHGQQPQCAVSISQAIDAKYVKAFGGKGTALQFVVPDNLLHPLTGIDNAVVNVTSKIAKVKSKGHGYFESIACKRGKRPIQVSFLTEAGQTSKASSKAKC
jgi:hypothetical protein